MNVFIADIIFSFIWTVIVVFTIAMFITYKIFNILVIINYRRDTWDILWGFPSSAQGLPLTDCLDLKAQCLRWVMLAHLHCKPILCRDWILERLILGSHSSTLGYVSVLYSRYLSHDIHTWFLLLFWGGRDTLGGTWVIINHSWQA